MTVLQPETAAELCDIVRAEPRLHARGKGSKTALHNGADGTAVVDLSALSGIIEYQPSEFTLTVRARARRSPK